MAIKTVPGMEVQPKSLKSNVGRLNERGQEIVDGRPMEPPVGFRAPPSLAEQIRAMVRSEALAHAAEMQGDETFEEADDFDTGEDDMDPRSPYEDFFEPTTTEELQREHEALRVALGMAPQAPGAPPVSGGGEPPKAAEAPPKGAPAKQEG